MHTNNHKRTTRLLRRKASRAAVGMAAFLWAAGSVNLGQAADQPELVKNLGFEDVGNGQLVNWGPSHPDLTAADGQVHAGGSWSAKLDTGGAAITPYMSQSIFEPKLNQKYAFRYLVRGGAGAETQYRGYVGIWKQNTNWVDGVATEWKTVSSTWQTNTVEFVLTKEASRMELVFQIQGTGAVWFDDVSLKPVAPDSTQPKPNHP